MRLSFDRSILELPIDNLGRKKDGRIRCELAMEGAYGSEHSTNRGKKAGCNREQIGRLYMISSTPFWCDAIDACEPRWRDNGEKTGGSYGRQAVQAPFLDWNGRLRNLP